MLLPLSYSRLNPRQSGFSLIEVLVAMLIFVLLAVMSYGGLQTVLNAEESFERHNDRLSELQMAFMLLGRDIEQAVNRPVRDNYGDTLAALIGGDGGFELTRSGRRNPAGLLRSQLQRVGWQIEDEQLMRMSWSVLDRAPNSEAAQVVMLDQVQALSIRFLSAQGEWFTEWPSSNQNQGQQTLPQPLPLAVEVNLDLSDWGEITRLYRLSVGKPVAKGSGA